MQFLTLLAMAIGLASAADICRTTGSGCTGSKVCCGGIQEGNCCNLNGVKSNILYTLPANSRGVGYTGSGCSGSTGSFQNPNKVTDRCVTFSWNVGSGKWLQGLGKREGTADENEVCADPNAAVYEVDGVEHKVKIPKGKVEDVSAWIEDGEWKKLAELEAYE